MKRYSFKSFSSLSSSESNDVERKSKWQKFRGKFRKIKSEVKRLVHIAKSICRIRLGKKPTFVPFHVWEAQYLERQRKMAESETQGISDETVSGEVCQSAGEEGLSPNKRRYPEFQRLRDENHSEPERHAISEETVSDEVCKSAVKEDVSLTETPCPEFWQLRDEKESEFSHMKQPSDLSYVNDVKRVCPKRANREIGEYEPSVSYQLK